MAYMVVTTGIHAARNIQVDITDIEQVIHVIEAALDRFGNRDRFGIGQGAKIAARAANDVCQQADVRRGDTQFPQLMPQFEQT